MVLYTVVYMVHDMVIDNVFNTFLYYFHIVFDEGFDRVCFMVFGIVGYIICYMVVANAFYMCFI